MSELGKAGNVPVKILPSQCNVIRDEGKAGRVDTKLSAMFIYVSEFGRAGRLNILLSKHDMA